jgi:site-specific DNA-methyltransferase (adenine-specific)
MSHRIPNSLEALAVPIDRLRAYPGNPRRGDVAAITDSLRRNGQYRPLVVNRPTMEVLAGNHTLAAARELGWTEVAATFVEVDEEQAQRIVLADNRTNDLAGYDAEALVALLGELPTLEGTGYDETALGELLDELAPPPLDEEVPPPPAEPRTAPGDLYRLGPHRLLCGDARNSSDLERLTDGEPPELLWTDPPYGVAYEGETADRLTIRGDGKDGLEALLAESFRSADACLAPGAPLYVAHPAGALSVTFGQCFLSAGWRLHQTLVWVKDAIVLGHADYHYRHEPILYRYKPAPGRLGRGGRGWHGSNAEDSLLEVPRPRRSTEHPTMKPPELIERCLRNSSRRGAAVLDSFGGSGSTLIACERTGRRARLLELDPRFCDVIVARFEALTGLPAEGEGA